MLTILAALILTMTDVPPVSNASNFGQSTAETLAVYAQQQAKQRAMNTAVAASSPQTGAQMGMTGMPPPTVVHVVYSRPPTHIAVLSHMHETKAIGVAYTDRDIFFTFRTVDGARSGAKKLRSMQKIDDIELVETFKPIKPQKP